MNLPFPKFVIVRSLLMNPCQYKVAVLKGQEFYGKHYERFFANFLCRKVKIMAFQTSLKIPEGILDEASHLGNTTGLIL